MTCVHLCTIEKEEREKENFSQKLSVCFFPADFADFPADLRRFCEDLWENLRNLRENLRKSAGNLLYGGED